MPTSLWASVLQQHWGIRMPGFPVVITDNGAPFVAVTEGAPVATVATNGLGVPITVVSENAPPLVIEGYTPPDPEPEE